MINPINFYAGGWMRMKDALIPYIGMEINNTRIGITYDVNTSALKTASSTRGGIEISLIYINRPSDTRNVPCPKF
jgi:cytidine deaminase